MKTINELLGTLQGNKDVKTLENTKETWERIANRDDFTELGMSLEEKEEFIKEWIKENEYANI